MGARGAGRRGWTPVWQLDRLKAGSAGIWMSIRRSQASSRARITDSASPRALALRQMRRHEAGDHGSTAPASQRRSASGSAS
ncbi:hypothetical protein IX55_15965 [Paracoccus sanguinis]|nr:hypothetical protein IX55_15965 [Paracoccus sanguinis]